MIEYLNILSQDRTLVGIIDTAQSVIWRVDYYGAGYFEVYISANPQTLQMLQVGNYVARNNERNVGIIESIAVTFDANLGQMITAIGRMTKSLLDRRIIYNLNGTSITPTVSRGNVEVAARNLVSRNIIASSVAARNIDFIGLGELANIDKVIVDEDGDAAQTQTSFGGLLSYTDSLLESYQLGSYMAFDNDSRKLLYTVFEGQDRSAGNAAGNAPIIFSQDFDNLASSAYHYDESVYKTMALIGGEGEGVNRFVVQIGGGLSGLDRREVWIDAGGQSRTYKDENDNDKTYTDTEYTALLQSAGFEALAPLGIVQTFEGTVNIANSGLAFGVDFQVGDMVTIQDNALGLFIKARILNVTEVQDESSYQVDITYGV